MNQKIKGIPWENIFPGGLTLCVKMSDLQGWIVDLCRSHQNVTWLYSGWSQVAKKSLATSILCPGLLWNIDIRSVKKDCFIACPYNKFCSLYNVFGIQSSTMLMITWGTYQLITNYGICLYWSLHEKCLAISWIITNGLHAGKGISVTGRNGKITIT